MCLSNVYEMRGEERHLLAKNISDIREDNGELILTDIMGIRTKLYADIESVDLMENYIIVKPYEFEAAESVRVSNGEKAAASEIGAKAAATGVCVKSAADRTFSHNIATGDIAPDEAEHRHSHSHYHSPEEKKKQVNRISKVIGHSKHVKQLIQNDADCSEVLVQISAVNAALRNLGKEIINEHMTHCIIHAIEDGDTSAVEAFREAVRKFV